MKIKLVNLISYLLCLVKKRGNKVHFPSFKEQRKRRSNFVVFVFLNSAAILYNVSMFVRVELTVSKLNQIGKGGSTVVLPILAGDGWLR